MSILRSVVTSSGALAALALGGVGVVPSCSPRQATVSQPADVAAPDAGAAGAGTWTASDEADAGRSLCPRGFVSALRPGHHTGFFSAGQGRTFELLVPDAKFTGPRPLVFAFHGTGLSGGQVIGDYHLQGWVDAGAIVIAPDSNGNGTLWPVWDSFVSPGEKPRKNADLELFDDLLSCTTVHYSVDPKRIYVLGQSAGGAMTNFLLGRRSDVLAGGIPASGAFDLTQPTPKEPIAPLTVIVTWGGSNDIYSGSSNGSSVSNAAYSEQSALASQYWEKQPGSHQIYCKGNEVGHSWLGSMSDWMRDVLLAHPKGSANTPGWTMPPLPPNPSATCSEEAAVYKPPVKANCPASGTPGCQAYCQLQGTCLVENGTFGPSVISQLGDLGWSTTEANVCNGCVAKCEADAKGSEADRAVLSCLGTAAPRTTCGPGILGAAIFGTVNGCCEKSGSKLCGRFCAAFKPHAELGALLRNCH